MNTATMEPLWSVYIKPWLTDLLSGGQGVCRRRSYAQQQLIALSG